MSGSPLFVNARKQPMAQILLLCFPHAGGGPASFFPWNALLGPEIECVSVQYPGRGQRWREPALSSMEDLVEEIFNGWEQIPQKTIAFYGHSFGGLVAFEVARRLRRAKLKGPKWLFVGASRAPQLEHWQTPIHSLQDGEFVEAVQARYGGIPAAIRADLDALRLFLGSMRNDLRAYENYCMKEECPLTIPITAFAGSQDRSVPPARVQGWETQTEAGFQMKVLPTGHFFTEGNLKAATECVRDCCLQLIDFPTRESREACIPAKKRGWGVDEA